MELLTTYAMTRDDRLAKRAIELFDFSRRNWGFVNERFPAFLPQQSPTFSLIWALMLNDYTFWRNDSAFVKARVIGLRSMLEHFEPYLNQAAERVAPVALESLRRSLRQESGSVDAVLLTGGGAALYEPVAKSLFPYCKLHIPDRPELANARGFFRYGAE